MKQDPYGESFISKRDTYPKKEEFLTYKLLRVILGDEEIEMRIISELGLIILFIIIEFEIITDEVV